MSTDRLRRVLGVATVILAVVGAVSCSGSSERVHREDGLERPMAAPPGVRRLVALFQDLPGDADAPALSTRGLQGYILAEGVVEAEPTITVEPLEGGEVAIATGSEETHTTTGETQRIEVRYLNVSLRTSDGTLLAVKVHLGGVGPVVDIAKNFPPVGSRLAVLVPRESNVAESFMGNEFLFDDSGQAVVVGGSIVDGIVKGDSFDEAVAQIKKGLEQQ